ncbi:hypothetical protein AG1IA_01228 [Rhizoctonia solani AG-1 IA]|uniref:Uncharacterized protein n=1 Tax=Thanatephorus cucumeris (strain AG1-IA) TaxID=983506 RepID=L8X6L9_THACA|nr:hypothetical protein AG1IA_01228 [Rhizoctonia solani AG-1 IA]
MKMVVRAESTSIGSEPASIGGGNRYRLEIIRGSVFAVQWQSGRIGCQGEGQGPTCK